MDSFETILYEERNGVATVTLNRPDVHNAFNYAMELELRTVWRSLRTNDDVRAIILTGAGEKAFCSGIDREETIQQGYIEGKETPSKTGMVHGPFMYNDSGVNINPKENDLWKPVIAAVNGMACGGAMYMLGEADIVIAAENATFFDPHVSYGMVAGFESVHLMQKLPLGETLRIALLGANERMSAARAHQVGLVSEVVPREQLLERARWIAECIAEMPVMAVQGTLRAIWMAHETSRREALRQVSAFVLLGTQFDNIAGGQQTFTGVRRKWQLR